MMSKPAVIFTFIRHGESMDNLRAVWAGWADAPLTNHGMNQAQALGAYLSSTPFTHIFASDLKRAHSTAQAVHGAQPAPVPPLTVSALLREQHFGEGEGKPWINAPEPGLTLEEHYARGQYPVLTDRAEKFPGGESSDDVRARAERAVRELLAPRVWEAARSGERGIHVAVVSHGLCISELIPAVLRLSGEEPRVDYRGLRNTAWTRVVVDFKLGQADGPLEFPDSDPPPIAVRVTDVNQHDHLSTVVRQKGGIGSSAHDQKQKDIRAFFGGERSSETDRPGTDVLEHAESNAEDLAGGSKSSL